MGVFIKTNDEQTKDVLENNGFEIVNYSNGVWTFLNNPKIHFDKNDYKEELKMAYTNILPLS